MTKQPTADEIASLLGATIGDNDESATVSQFLDTGYPELNYGLSARFDGGFGVGRMHEIAGPPSSGKTAIATVAMASAQRAGGVAAFCDHERSFSERLGPRLGLDITPGKWIYKKPRTFEESLDLAARAATMIREKKLIAPEAPICWVFDSLAAMVAKSAMFDAKSGKEKEAADRNMNDNTALARATSAAFPAFAQYCEELGICALFMNQIRMKLNVMYGDPRTTPGGEASKFFFSTRTMLGASKIVKDKVTLGTEITALIIKNKISRPFLSAQYRFVFQEDGTGKFDTYRSMIDFLVREGQLKQSGAFIEFDGGKFHAEPLARKLEAAGDWSKLIAKLPARYFPDTSADAVALGAEGPTTEKEEA